MNGSRTADQRGPALRDNADLRARLAAGKAEAIEDCYLELGPTVLAYVRRRVPPDDAEDVLQRVFVEVWRSAARYDPSRSLEAWVLAIARRRTIDYLRANTRRTTPTESFADVAGDDGRKLADGHVEARAVHDAMEKLAPEQREVLTLAYFGGYTQTEIAARLGLPLGTVKTRTARGLRRLAALLRTTRWSDG